MPSNGINATNAMNALDEEFGKRMMSPGLCNHIISILATFVCEAYSNKKCEQYALF
jgi:hypothetical protein